MTALWQSLFSVLRCLYQQGNLLAMHRDINESHIADKLITVGNSTESVGMFDSVTRSTPFAQAE